LEKRQTPSIERDLRRDETDDGGHSAEDEGFGEQLSDDPAATRAECAPHYQLVFARRGAGEQQQCNVSAYENEKHQCKELNRHPGKDAAGPLSLKLLRIHSHLRLEVFVRVAPIDRGALA